MKQEKERENINETKDWLFENIFKIKLFSKLMRQTQKETENQIQE